MSKNKHRKNFERFDLLKSRVEIRDEMALQERLQEKKEEEILELNKKNRCPSCGFFTNSEENMKDHMKIKHGVKHE